MKLIGQPEVLEPTHNARFIARIYEKPISS